MAVPVSAVAPPVERVAILVDPDRLSSAMPRLGEVLPGGRPLPASPIVLADAHDPGLAAARDLDGVLGVDTLDPLLQALVQGIDWAVRVALAVDERWALGGVTDARHHPYVRNGPRGTVAPSAVCAAVNLSLTPSDEHLRPTRPDDVVNHATRYLSQWTVPVLAAGNRHTRGARFETVSPWAEPAWVLAVGATEDPAGEREWARSARGTAARPDVTPDVLAWGRNPFDDTEFGTSFAAARVSGLLCLAHAWLLQVAANVDRLAGRPFGVPLVGPVVVDKGFAGVPAYGPRIGWPALPVFATDPSAAELEGVAEQLRSPHTARRLVEAAARATSPATGLSAPSITQERLRDWLDRASAVTLAAVLTGDTTTAAGPALFPAGTATWLWELVDAAMPLWEFDVRTGLARMRPEQQGDPS